MKNLKLIFGIGLVLFLSALVAFTPPAGDKYAYGKRKAVTLTVADTIEVAPNNLTLTYATLSLDTNVVVDVNVDNSIIGDMIFLEITADSTNRHLTFNDNVTAVADSVVATKTKLFCFVFNGTVFRQYTEEQVD